MTDNNSVNLHHRKRRRILVASAGTIAGLALLPLARSQSPRLEPVTLSVPGPGGGVSLPIELAVKIGADKAEGLSLRLKFVGGGGVAIADLHSGNADFGIFGLPAAMLNNLKQPSLVALAAIDDLPLYTLVVRKDLRGRISRISDLKGRRIGIHSNSLHTQTTSHQVLESILRSRGLAPTDVSFIAAGQTWETQSAILMSGSADATMTDEPFATRLASENIGFILYSTGNPNDARTVPGAGFLRAALISRRDHVEGNPELARRVVAVVRRTLAWMALQQPEDIAAAMGLSSAQRQSFVDVYRRYPRQYSRDGKFSRAQLSDTDVFFRAAHSLNAEAARFSVDAMVIDRWAGSKP